MANRRTNEQHQRSRLRRQSSHRSKQLPNERSRQWHTIDEHGRPQSGCVLLTDDDSSSDWDSSAPLSVLPRSRGRKRPIRSSSLAARRALRDEEPSIDDWVRNLVELRRWRQLPRTTTLTSATQEWLSEQHHALENATLPFLLKCILTVCNASPTFHHFRKDFMRPEYRNRYWSWCLKFVELVDYYLDYGHVKVHLRGGQRYKPLMIFIQNAQEQREEATLQPLQEQVLSAIGVQWERAEHGFQHREDIPSELEHGNPLGYEPNDNQWYLDSAAHPNPLKTKFDSISQDKTKRRKFGSAPPTVPPTKTKPHSSVFDSGYSAGMAGSENGPARILDWARHIVELRPYFREGKGYEIPPNRTNLAIWMHSETARSMTGALPAICCCILKVTKVTNAVDDTVYISEECESWCKCYVEYLDFALETYKTGHATHEPTSTVTGFMLACRKNSIEGVLSEERSALLRAVDAHWRESELMGISIRRSRAKPNRVNMVRNNSFGSVEEVELDSGAPRDARRGEPRELRELREPREPRKPHKLRASQRRREPSKKRKPVHRHTAKKCKAMVSAMITGVVGETVEGRKRTTAEKRAAEWVSESGTEALNKYAQMWFTDATMKNEKDRKQ